MEFRSVVEREAWRKLDGLSSFHWTDLRKRGVPESSAKIYLGRWERAGLIECVRAEGNMRWYARIGESAPQAPGRGPQTAEDAMWVLMRRRAHFAPADLVAMAQQVGLDVTEEAARAYCRRLLVAGYLRCIQQAVPGKRPATYRLVNNTGPKAPVARRVTGVLDPNTGEFHAKEVTS